MMEWVNQYVLGTAVPLLLMICGLFFGARLRFFHIRHPVKMLRKVLRRERGESGSSFRALMLALAGTLGVGNIVGVAAAIAMGGAGAIFWMWVSAFCAMLLKYAEIVLALRHRRFDEGGKPYGSAMQYIKDGFAVRGMPRLGVALASVFAGLCLVNAVSMGSIIQVNAIARAWEGVFHVSPWIVGGLLAVTVFWVIRKGSERILKLTETLVPLMTVGYLVLSVAVLILRAEQIPAVLTNIFFDAFAPEATVGGIGGFLLSRSIRFGTMRGLISNEAGCGTAPMAHATAQCSLPAKQGGMGIFEVFVDTLLLCTVTALVILVGVGESGAVGDNFMMITLNSYSAVLGDAAACFMAVAVLFFGFATVICWAHYGMESVHFLTKHPRGKSCFIAVYILSVVIGSCAASDWIWQLADLAVGAMTVINLCVLVMMSKEVQKETEDYFF